MRAGVGRHAYVVTTGSTERVPDDLDALASSFDALAVDATELRAEAAAAGGKVTLVEDFEAQLRAEAEALRGASSRAEVAPASPLQGERVWNRGVAAWFLLQVVDAFEGANELDPTVPRIGLQQLRAALRPKASKKPAKKGDAKKADAKTTDAKADAKTAEGAAAPAVAPTAPVKG